MEKNYRIGFVGYGNRGKGLLNNYIQMDDVDIVAVCDKLTERQQTAAEAVKAKKGYLPICTDNYQDLLNMKIDALVVATSWADHVNIAIDAMNAGIPVGIEVGGAYSVEECWDLVRTHESTKTPIMMLTNTRYDRRDMAVVNMAKQGLFGRVAHCDGGYCHDLRVSMVDMHENHHYRLTNYMMRNSDNYPCHAMAVLSMILDINRGNKLLSLSSVASPAWGINDYVKNHFGEDHKFAHYPFAQSDIVTTTIRCARGETITLRLDTSLPRSYSRRLEVHGTKGMFMEDGNLVYLEDEHSQMRDKPRELYNNADAYVEKYAHRIWKDCAQDTGVGMSGGHGGTDYLVNRAFLESVRNGLPMPTDIYDTAILLALTPLSEMSIANGGAFVDVPDFTKGRYLTRKPITPEENPWSPYM